MDFDEYFKQFLRTMIGKEDYLFLVNDASNEIKQHYDENYKSITFDENIFAKQLSDKKEFLNNKNINYDFFIVPDKSIVLRDYLPFETQQPYRCVDKLNAPYITDLIDVMEVGDYQYDDTHMSELSAIKVVANILKKIHPEVDVEEYKQILTAKLSIEEYVSFGDLLFQVNWSYSRDHPVFKKHYHSIKKRYIPVDSSKVTEKEVPDEFNKMGSRETIYLYNKNSISDKTAIVLRDSTTDKLIHVISAYYREVIFYWDHYYFDKELIEWFKPDDVIEIRTERFIANPIKYTISDDGEVLLTSDNIRIQSLEYIRGNILHLWVDIPALRIMPLNAECDILLNGNLLSTEIMDGSSSYHLHYFLDYYPKEYLSKKLQVSVKFKRLLKRE